MSKCKLVQASGVNSPNKTSALNKKLLKEFPANVNLVGGSSYYDMLFGEQFVNFFGRWFATGDPVQDAKIEEFYNRAKNTLDQNGEPKLYKSGDEFYFLNYKNERYTIKQKTLSDKDKLELINSMGFVMNKSKNGEKASTFIPKFLKSALNALEKKHSELNIANILEKDPFKRIEANQVLNNLNKKIKSIKIDILENKEVLNSIINAVDSNLKGFTNLKYKDEADAKEEDLGTHSDIAKHINDSDMTNDANNINDEISKIIHSMQDYDFGLDGVASEKMSSLLNLAIARNASTVKNKLVETLSNIIEIDLPKEGYINDVYSVMMDKLRDLSINNDDLILGQFHNAISDLYESKSENDKKAFKVKLANSFHNGKNMFTITEVSQDKNNDSTYTLRHIDPASQQDKISMVADEMFKDSMNFFSGESGKLQNFDNIKLAAVKAIALDDKMNRNQVREIFDLLGINLESKTIDSLFKNRDNVLKNISSTETLTLREFFIGKKDKAGKGMFDFISAYADKGFGGLVKTFLKAKREDKADIIKDYLDRSKNTPFSILSQYEVINKPDIADSSMYIGKSQRWMYSLMSGMQKEILEWKTGNKRSLLNKQGKNLNYVNYLLAKDLGLESTLEERERESDRRIARLEVITNSEIKEKMDNNPVLHGEITQPDLHMDNMFKMFNHLDIIYDKIRNKTTNSGVLSDLEYKNISPNQFSADKTGSYSIKGLGIIAKGVDIDKSGFISGLGADNKKIIGKYILGEYNQIKKDSKLIQDYYEIKNKKARQMFMMDNLIAGFHYRHDLSLFNPEDADQTIPFELVNQGSWSKFGFFNSVLTKDTTNIAKLFTSKRGYRQAKADMDSIIVGEITDKVSDFILKNIKNDLVTLKDLGGLGNEEGSMMNKTNILNSNKDVVQAQYLLNSLFNNIELFQMFNGDLGFYKQSDKKGEVLDMKDALKRGPAPLTDGRYPVLSNKSEMKDYKKFDGKSVKYDANKHSTVAIVNEIKINKSIHQNLISKGTNGRLSDYDHELADAQGLGSIYFFKKMVSKVYGWTDNDDMIYNRLNDKNHEYNQDDIDWLKLSGRSMAALKLTGLDKVENIVDGNVNNEVSVFLKYAVAILAPAMVSGTDLEILMNKMNDSGVEQVVFKSGSKAANMTQTSIHKMKDGQFDGIDPNMKLNPFLFSMKQLKWQVELPTKFDKEGTLGNQHLKNLIANLDMDSNEKNYSYRGRRLSGRELYDEYTSVIKSMLKDQLDAFTKEISLEFNEGGSITFNQKTLRKLVARQLDAVTDQDILDILNNVDMPLETIPGIAQRMYPIIAGYIHKNVTKLRTNSSSLIQVANIGFDRVSKKDRNNVIYLTDDLELRPPLPKTDKDGNILYFNENGESSIKKKGDFTKMRIAKSRIMLPFSSIYSKLGISYEALNEMIASGNNKEELDKIFNNIIGYRIPNQAISSNDSYEVVGILPPNMGDIAVVYGEITGKTGSDFDIDKMYMMMPNFEINEDKDSISYIEDDSQKGNQNKLIELMGSILESEKTYDDLISQLDDSVVKIKETIIKINYEKMLRDNPGSSMTFEEFMQSREKDPLEQMSAIGLVAARVDMLMAKKLVATMANHMSDIPMSQIAKQLMKYDIGIKDANFSNIFAIGKEGDVEWKLTKIVSYLMNAAVDAAKDNYIIEGNFNGYTANGAMVLFRLGVTPENVFKLLMNDDVLALTKAKQLNSQKFNSIKMPEEYSQESLNEMSRNFMMKNGKKEIDFNKFINKGYSREDALGYWNIIALSGKEFNNDIVSSKSDSNGPGKNIYEQLSLLNRLKVLNNQGIVSDVNGGLKTGTKMYEDGIENESLMFDPNIHERNDVTFLGNMLNNGLLLAKHITKSMLIEATDGYQEAVSLIMAQLGDSVGTDVEKIKMISNTIYPYILSKTNHPIYNITKAQVDYLTDSFPSEFNKKKQLYSNNLFMQQMFVNNSNNLITFANYRNYSSGDKMLIKESLKNLMAQDPEFAMKLVKYSFLTTGFKQTYFSFNEYMPLNFFIGTGHHNSISSLLERMKNSTGITSGELSDILKFIAINNPDNYKIVKAVKDTGGISSGVRIEGKKLKEKVTSKSKRSFVPFVKKKGSTNLFMIVDVIKERNEEGVYQSYPVYQSSKSNVTKDSKGEKMKLFDFNTMDNNNSFKEESKKDVYIQDNIEYISDLDMIFDESKMKKAKSSLSLENNDEIFEDESIEQLYEKNKEKLEANDVSLDLLEEMEEEFGYEATVEYINKCL